MFKLLLFYNIRVTHCVSNKLILLSFIVKVHSENYAKIVILINIFPEIAVDGFSLQIHNALHLTQIMLAPPK